MKKINTVLSQLVNALVIVFGDLALQYALGIYIGYNTYYKRGFSPFQSWSYLLLVLIGIFLSYQFALKRGFLKPFRQDRFHARTFSIGFASLYTWSFVFGIAMNLLGMTTTANQESVDNLTTMLPVLVTFSFASLAGPFFEELLLRQWVFHIFGKKRIPAIFTSSLLFGLIHMASGFQILAFVLYAGMGLILALVYDRTQSFKTVFIIHLAWNTFALVLTL